MSNFQPSEDELEISRMEAETRLKRRGGLGSVLYLLDFLRVTREPILSIVLSLILLRLKNREGDTVRISRKNICEFLDDSYELSSLEIDAAIPELVSRHFIKAEEKEKGVWRVSVNWKILNWHLHMTEDSGTTESILYRMDIGR